MTDHVGLLRFGLKKRLVSSQILSSLVHNCWYYCLGAGWGNGIHWLVKEQDDSLRGFNDFILKVEKYGSGGREAVHSRLHLSGCWVASHWHSVDTTQWRKGSHWHSGHCPNNCGTLLCNQPIVQHYCATNQLWNTPRSRLQCNDPKLCSAAAINSPPRLHTGGVIKSHSATTLHGQRTGFS